MKIAITGYTGFVGTHLMKLMPTLVPVDGDITDEEKMSAVANDIKPDLLIHCASMTNVDECEKHPDDAFKVNVKGTLNIVNSFECPMIYLSTDHVFKGNPKPWLPTENTYPNPVNIYGLTKYSGEVIAKTSMYPVSIIRSSKLYSSSTLAHDINELRHGNERTFTSLLRRNFTHVAHFCQAIMEYIDKGNWDRGYLLHLASPTVMSYYEFWKKVAKTFDIPEYLVISRNYPLPDVSPRPFHGGFSVDKARKLGLNCGNLELGLALVKQEMENYV